MRLFEGTQWDRPPRCEQCGELEEDCRCPPVPQTLIAPQTQTARVAVEKRSKGKLVTIVRGLPAEGNDLQSLLLRLKTACGAGGTLKGDPSRNPGKPYGPCSRNARENRLSRSALNKSAAGFADVPVDGCRVTFGAFPLPPAVCAARGRQ